RPRLTSAKEYADEQERRIPKHGAVLRCRRESCTANLSGPSVLELVKRTILSMVPCFTLTRRNSSHYGGDYYGCDYGANERCNERGSGLKERDRRSAFVALATQDDQSPSCEGRTFLI